MVYQAGNIAPKLDNQDQLIQSVAQDVLKQLEATREEQGQPKFDDASRKANLEAIEKSIRKDVAEGNDSMLRRRDFNDRAKELLSGMGAELEGLKNEGTAEVGNASRVDPALRSDKPTLPKVEFLLPEQDNKTLHPSIEKSSPDKAARDNIDSSNSSDNSLDSVVEEKAKSEVEHAKATPFAKISFTDLGADCVFHTSSRYLAIDSAGDLNSWERGANGEGAWVKADKVPEGQMRVAALYQADDGKIYDSKGGEVNQLSTYSGSVPMSLVLAKVDSLEEGKLSSVSASVNAYFHEGKHVVFTKGNPPGLEGEVSPAVVEPAKSEDSAKVETEKDHDRLEGKARYHSEQTYHVKDRSGQFQEVKTYARKSTDGDLEMYMGKTKEGKDVWVDSARTNFTAVYVHEGKAYSAQGKELGSLQTGPYAVGTSNVLSKLSFGESGIGTLDSKVLNDFTIGGKKVMFVEGKPPVF